MSTIKDDIPSSPQPGSFVIKPKAARPPVTIDVTKSVAKVLMTKLSPKTTAPNWWFSEDGRRGFSWPDVVAYTYHEGGTEARAKAAIYLYLHAGIYHLTGSEAESVYEMCKVRVKNK